METDTPLIKEAHWVRTNGLTAGERGIPVFRESTVTPLGSPLIPDNAYPKLSVADATYFSVRQSKNPFSGRFSCMIKMQSLTY